MNSYLYQGVNTDFGLNGGTIKYHFLVVFFFPLFGKFLPLRDRRKLTIYVPDSLCHYLYFLWQTSELNTLYMEEVDLQRG